MTLRTVIFGSNLWIFVNNVRVVTQTVIAQCAQDPSRCVIEGPDIALSPKTALSLSLAMHELATNALKHGAWSTPNGKVSVTWRRYVPAQGGGERLHLEWRETGGPKVTAPEKRGFGSRLIERGLASEMGGEAKIHFEPDGVVCIVDAPLTVYKDE